MSDDEEKLDRRAFLRRAGLAGIVAVGAGGLTSSCKKNGDGSDKGGGGGGGGGSKQGSGELTCDKSELTDGQKSTRNNLKYVDHSEKSDQNCLNCKFYEKPDKEGTCGGCTVVPGPIHPKGWCTSWAKAAG